METPGSWESGTWLFKGPFLGPCPSGLLCLLLTPPPETCGSREHPQDLSYSAAPTVVQPLRGAAPPPVVNRGTRRGKAPSATVRRQLRRDGHAHAAFSTCPRRWGHWVHRLCFPSKGLGDPLGPSGSALECECRKLAHTFCISVLQCGSSLSPSRPHWQCLESLGSFFRLVALINSKDHMPTRVSNWSMHGPSSRHGGRKTECL